MNNDEVYKQLKRAMPTILKKKIKNTLFLLKIKKQLKPTNNIFLSGTPIHGNLGDHAIALAEYQFFSEYLPEYNVIELTSNQVIENIDVLNKVIGEDIICITGGGFLGTLWEEEERMSRMLINKFPNNKMIILPQTIYYENSEKDMLMLEQSKDLYNKSKDLHICAREEASYEFVKKEYPNTNILFVPDIVTCLSGYESKFKRDGILLCLRSDKESIQKETFRDELRSMASRYSENIRFTDTVISSLVFKEDRRKCVKNKLDEFGSSKLVITDRLHGMIFSAISGTPCIAINNKSGKVKGVYQWLQNLEYIKFVESEKEIEQHINTLLNLDKCRFDNNHLVSYFEEIENLFRGKKINIQ